MCPICTETREEELRDSFDYHVASHLYAFKFDNWHLESGGLLEHFVQLVGVCPELLPVNDLPDDMERYAPYFKQWLSREDMRTPLRIPEKQLEREYIEDYIEEQLTEAAGEILADRTPSYGCDINLSENY